MKQDADLAAQAQRGDMTAFATLVDRHKDRVYHTLFRVVGHEQDAQDLAQELFIKVYRSLDSYRGDAAFATWLHRMALNLAFDYLRARRRRPLQVPLPPAPQRAPPEADPATTAVDREHSQELQTAVDSLPPHYRQVILLRHGQHLSYREIADRLRIPLRTVETRLYRAHALLKARLRPLEGGEHSELHGDPAPARRLSAQRTRA